MNWTGRFRVRGVFWRRLLRTGVRNVPAWLEPVMIAFWTLVFLVWGPGRRGVMHNLAAILPGSRAAANVLRTYRVFWNFAWTIADNVRFQELRTIPDWDFAGFRTFEDLRTREGGAIVLTAHMGNYDLGAHLFAGIAGRQIVMVRAPETDPETRTYEGQRHGHTAAGPLRVDFSTRAGELAIDLLGSLQRGEIVAIQGDRVTAGVAPLPATLFGRVTSVPAGPFVLAMTARVPIYPLFVVRRGRRAYRLVAFPPLHVVRTRDRDAALARAVAEWTATLETVLAAAWDQWFTFEPYSREAAG